MAHTCTIIVVDEDGGLLVERILPAEEAVAVLAIALRAANPLSAEAEDDEPEENKDNVVPQNRSRRGRNKCSLCGKMGHTKRKCPNLNREPLDREASEEPSARRFFSREDYDKVRDAMHQRDFMSNQYALTQKLSPKEVNAAVRSTDYDDYRQAAV